MLARRLALLEQVTCASPAYLAAHGTPENLAQLDGHRAVNFFSAQTGKVWPFDFKVAGQRHSVALPGSVSVNNADAYHACRRVGLGLIQAPRHHLEQALATGELVEVLGAVRPGPLPVSVLYPITGNCRRACACLPSGLILQCRIFLTWAKKKIPLVMPSSTI
ncbi:LysR substrate-binding domain-containing protein [Janthinobacterium sp. GB4P2]|uniref:LysR substrate-binding domain-containing protein n=1 Tax=Janthinobacterium sp. GB4P2 TaxID=3424189 RepID=UPI003F208B0D